MFLDQSFMVSERKVLTEFNSIAQVVVIEFHINERIIGEWNVRLMNITQTLLRYGTVLFIYIIFLCITKWFSFDIQQSKIGLRAFHRSSYVLFWSNDWRNNIIKANRGKIESKTHGRKKRWYYSHVRNFIIFGMRIWILFFFRRVNVFSTRKLFSC